MKILKRTDCLFLFIIILTGCTQAGNIYEIDSSTTASPIIEAFVNVSQNEVRILGGVLPVLFKEYSYKDYNESILNDEYSFSVKANNGEEIQIPKIEDTLNFKAITPYFYKTPFNYWLKPNQIINEQAESFDLNINHPEFGSFILSENLPSFPDSIHITSLDKEVTDFWHILGNNDTASVFTLTFSNLPDNYYVQLFIFRSIFINQNFSGGALRELKTNNPLLMKRRLLTDAEESYLFTTEDFLFFNELTKFYYAPDKFKTEENETNLNLHIRILSKNLYNYLKSIYDQPKVSIAEQPFIEPTNIFTQIPGGIGVFGVFKEFIIPLD